MHLELEVEHNLARGMSGHEARRASRIAFGGVARFREEAWEARDFVALVFGVMFRPLAYPESARLVQIRALTPGLGIGTAMHSEGTFPFSKRAHAFVRRGRSSEPGESHRSRQRGSHDIPPLRFDVVSLR